MVTAARNQKKVPYQPLSTVPTNLPISPQWGEVDISVNVKGTLPIAHGGTGTTTATGTGSVVLETNATLNTPTLDDATATTNLTIDDGANIVFDTVTGTEIGSSNTQKLSLWGTPPDVQPTTAIAAAAFVANTSGTLNDSATFGGYTIGQIVAALQRLGALD